MKKIICLILVLLLILSVAMPVFAVTPDLQTSSISIPDISDDVHVELPDSAFEGYIPDIDIELPEATEEPTEPPAEEQPDHPWCDWLHKWLRWWRDKIC